MGSSPPSNDLFTYGALRATKRGRFLGESNFGKYAMRLCDFMVDYLGVPSETAIFPRPGKLENIAIEHGPVEIVDINGYFHGIL